MKPELEKALTESEKEIDISICSSDLDDTEWGQNLVTEFGRLTAERIISFLNKNGISYKIPAFLEELTINGLPRMSIQFDSHSVDSSPPLKMPSTINGWSLYINGKRQKGISKIKIPELDKKSSGLMQLAVVYKPDEYFSPNTKEDQDALDNFDFSKAHKAMYHINRMKINDRQKHNLMTSLITDLANEQGINVDVDKVIDILEKL